MVAQPFESDELVKLIEELKVKYNKSNGQDQQLWHEVSVYQLSTEYLVVAIHAQEVGNNTRFLIYRLKNYATTQLMKKEILATLRPKDDTKDFTRKVENQPGCERLNDSQISQIESKLSGSGGSYAFKFYSLHKTDINTNKDAGALLVYWEQDRKDVHLQRIFMYSDHKTTESFISEVESFDPTTA